MGIPVRALLRQKGTPYHELNLDGPKWTDDQLLDLMMQYPILINRPIVVTDKGVRLCRPSETVLDYCRTRGSALLSKRTVKLSSRPTTSPQPDLDDLPNVDPDVFRAMMNQNFIRSSHASAAHPDAVRLGARAFL